MATMSPSSCVGPLRDALMAAWRQDPQGAVETPPLNIAVQYSCRDLEETLHVAGPVDHRSFVIDTSRPRWQDSVLHEVFCYLSGAVPVDAMERALFRDSLWAESENDDALSPGRI